MKSRTVVLLPWKKGGFMSACKTLWELCSHGDSLGSALGTVEREGEEVGSLCFTLTDPTQKKETYFLGRREREKRRDNSA